LGKPNVITACAENAITELLAGVRAGNEKALEDLIRIAYPELRRLARHYMGQERPDQTLQPTALVHEAARIMRNLPVDHAK
jgi:hypothetical protein